MEGLFSSGLWDFHLNLILPTIQIVFMVEHLTLVHTKRISNSITVFFYTGLSIPSYQSKEHYLLKASCFSSHFLGNLQLISAISSEVAFITALRTVPLRKPEAAVLVCLVLESDKISCLLLWFQQKAGEFHSVFLSPENVKPSGMLPVSGLF